MPNPIPKKHFSFPAFKTSVPEHHTERSAEALEFIAYYLDQIEGHLERIANSVENGGVNEKLRLQLMNLEKTIDLGRK
jgi:hypothetical protein